MMNLHERMLPTSAGVEPGLPWSPVGRASTCQRGRPVWELWPAQDLGFRGDNYITKTVRVVCLACDMPTSPPLHSYQVLSKYV